MTEMEVAMEDTGKQVGARSEPFDEMEKLFREAEMDYDQNKKNLVGG